MVFPTDFSILGIFWCHIASQNTGGNFSPRSLGARKFFYDFSPPMVPPMLGPAPGPIKLPHGVRKSELGGPGVNFSFLLLSLDIPMLIRHVIDIVAIRHALFSKLIVSH